MNKMRERHEFMRVEKKKEEKKVVDKRSEGRSEVSSKKRPKP